MCVEGNCNRREKRITIRKQRKESVRFTIRMITVRAGNFTEKGRREENYIFPSVLYFFPRVRDLCANPQRRYMQHVQIPRHLCITIRDCVWCSRRCSTIFFSFIRSFAHITARTCRQYLGCTRREFSSYFAATYVSFRCSCH